MTSVSYAGLAALGLGVCASCLVTDKVEFGAPNVPPQVKLVSPRGALINVPEADECGNLDGMKFVVEISDPNVEDELVLRLVVQSESVSAQGTGAIPVTGEAARGTRDVCIAKDQLRKFGPCSLVEFLVSSDFGDPAPYAVKFPGDRGEAHVLVGANAIEEPQSPKSDCISDAGAP